MAAVIRTVAWFVSAASLLAQTEPASHAATTAPVSVEVERLRLSVGALTFDARAAGPADGELVLLLHGFPQTSFAWRHQLQALAGAGYRAVAPDQRGYSPDARPEGVDEYAMAKLVGDVIGMAKALHSPTFHLVGHDWGGAVAWVVAARFPDAVRSLTVFSTPHYAAFGAAVADASSAQAKRSSYFQVFGAPGAEDKFLADDAAFLRGLFQGSGLTDAEVGEYVEALGDPAAMRAALNWYGAMLRARAKPATTTPGSTPPPKIRVPTLYVWSTADPAFDRAPAAATAAFVEADRYRFEVLEGISHWIPEQAAVRVNTMLLEHLRGAAASSGK